MKSLAFPEMFSSNETKTITDSDATKQNCVLLLYSEKGELIGDPYYGIRLRKYIYEQNDYIMSQVLIEEIYAQLAVFMPQLRVNKNDIRLVRDKAKLTCRFKAINQIDFTTDMYNIVLFNNDGTI